MTNVRLYSYSLKTSLEKWPIRKGLILECENGWGEIAPLPGFSQESFEDARDELLTLLPLLRERTGRQWLRANAASKLPSVQFGIAQALQRFPVTALQVPLCLLNDPQPGFSTLKLKLGHLRLEEAILKIQHCIGAYRLRLDFNRAWTFHQALSLTRRYHPSDFDYLEEPIQNFWELPYFSALTKFPLAIDENVQKFKTVSDIPTLRAMVIKPTLVGALPKGPAPLVLSSAIESSLGLLQIACLWKEGMPAVGLDTFRFFEEDLLIPPLKAENGFLTWSATNAFPIDRSKLDLFRK